MHNYKRVRQFVVIPFFFLTILFLTACQKEKVKPIKSFEPNASEYSKLYEFQSIQNNPNRTTIWMVYMDTCADCKQAKHQLFQLLADQSPEQPLQNYKNVLFIDYQSELGRWLLKKTSSKEVPLTGTYDQSRNIIYYTTSTSVKQFEKLLQDNPKP